MSSWDPHIYLFLTYINNTRWIKHFIELKGKMDIIYILSSNNSYTSYAMQIIYVYFNLSTCYSWGKLYVEKTYIFDVQSDYTSDSALRHLIRNSHCDRFYTTENRSRKWHLIVILINNLHAITSNYYTTSTC